MREHAIHQYTRISLCARRRADRQGQGGTGISETARMSCPRTRTALLHPCSPRSPARRGQTSWYLDTAIEKRRAARACLRLSHCDRGPAGPARGELALHLHAQLPGLLQLHPRVPQGGRGPRRQAVRELSGGGVTRAYFLRLGFAIRTVSVERPRDRASANKLQASCTRTPAACQTSAARRVDARQA